MSRSTIEPILQLQTVQSMPAIPKNTSLVPFLTLSVLLTKPGTRGFFENSQKPKYRRLRQDYQQFSLSLPTSCARLVENIPTRLLPGSACRKVSLSILLSPCPISPVGHLTVLCGRLLLFCRSLSPDRQLKPSQLVSPL